ncbi:universal stress protein [Peristeroidobacter soli]|jgi:universal stress protein E|uniref:universal stress protein n=1 Tax=Peristeroidobacter soli TaxID=2497877 RepID=UPI00101C5117|nr:universal stress protein [Peristeroidobacter soli]
MNRTWNSRPILVAVRAPAIAARPILRKAAALAKLYQAPLRFVHVLPIPQSSLARASATIREAAEADLEDRISQLKRLGELAVLRGLPVSTAVRRDYPVQDALIREAMESDARMLLMESNGHGRFTRLFLSNMDWELIRNCPCPLWLSKSVKFDPRAPVLAAVDPLHSHAKPAMLDDIVVANAIEATGARADKVMLCHAFDVREPALIDSPEAYWFAMSQEDQRAHQQDLEQGIARLQRNADIPAENSVVVRGDPAIQLPRLAKKYGASIVVMGAVSRRGLKRVFIGNTAERVLDKLPCDVLVVKPRGFQSPVDRRTYRDRTERPRRHLLTSRRRQSGGDITHVAH